MIQMSVVSLIAVAVLVVLVLIVLGVVCVRASGTWVRHLWPH